MPRRTAHQIRSRKLVSEELDLMSAYVDAALAFLESWLQRIRAGEWLNADAIATATQVRCLR